MVRSLNKHKTRLVARGFTQVDYNEAHLYAPVMRLEFFRILLTIAAWFDLDLHQFDVQVAHLHGKIDGDVYMEPSPGHGDGDSVWKLLKGLYGLKQAGRICHEGPKADMEELGYTLCHRGHAVLLIGTRRKSNWAVWAFWVDDETSIGSREQLDRVAGMFRRKDGISGEGELDWYEGNAKFRQPHRINLAKVLHRELSGVVWAQNTTPTHARNHSYEESVPKNS